MVEAHLGVDVEDRVRRGDVERHVDRGEVGIGVARSPVLKVWVTDGTLLTVIVAESAVVGGDGVGVGAW